MIYCNDIHNCRNKNSFQGLIITLLDPESYHIAVIFLILLQCIGISIFSFRILICLCLCLNVGLFLVHWNSHIDARTNFRIFLRWSECASTRYCCTWLPIRGHPLDSWYKYAIHAKMENDDSNWMNYIILFFFSASSS